MELDVWKKLRAGEPGVEDRWRAIRTSVGADADGPPLTSGQIDRLRKSEGPDLARFVSLQEELQKRSRRRFSGPSPLFWTSKGLEQATPAVVADYRAARFNADLDEAGVIWDACCGIGSDAVSLLRGGGTVLATDWDPASARCAAANLRVELDSLGGHGAVSERPMAGGAARADLRRPPLAPETLKGALVLLDPDRRPDGEHREPRPERWAPALSKTLELAHAARGGCIKLPPSLDATAEGLDDERDGPRALEWISLDGEMKELAVWTGSLASFLTPGDDTTRGWATARRAATALQSSPASPENGPADRPKEDPAEDPRACLAAPRASYAPDAAPCPLPEAWPVEALGPGSWLVELDPSLWQSELAGPFCEEHQVAPIVTEMRGMFLAASEPPSSALARSWPILEVVKADRKRVRRMLREHGIGPLTVKKRNHPKTSTELEAEFRGPGERRGLLAVFRIPGGSVAALLGPSR